MNDSVPFVVDNDKKPRLNLAKLGEAGIGAGVAATLIWGLLQSNLEHTSALQESYINLLQQHNAVFLESTTEYYKQVNTDMAKVVNNLGDVVELVKEIQSDQRSWVIGQMRTMEARLAD